MFKDLRIRNFYPTLPWNAEMLEAYNFFNCKHTRLTSTRFFEIFLFRKFKDVAFLVNSRYFLLSGCIIYVHAICRSNISFLFLEPVILLMHGLTVAESKPPRYFCWRIWKLEYFQQCIHIEM
jgi:hypothetical protein